jgi:hypothetical protein
MPISPAESTVNLFAGSFGLKYLQPEVIDKYFPNKPLKFLQT